MSRSRLWLTDARFSKTEPHLPTDTRGKARVDDRRAISGIMQVLKTGGRWVDAPPEYGPRKKLYNRFVRRAENGAWADVFHALAAELDELEEGIEVLDRHRRRERNQRSRRRVQSRDSGGHSDDDGSSDSNED